MLFKRALIGLLFLAGLALVFAALRPAHAPSGTRTQSPPGRDSKGAPSAPTSARASTDAGDAQSAAAPNPVNGAPISTPPPGEAPLRAMVSLLAEMTRPGRSLPDLLHFLEATGQKPFVVENKNEYTGAMSIVRTKSPFPGTRYFHAQFFDEENGQKFLQHLSFEYKASPTALDEALKTVHEVFPSLGKPMHDVPGFTQWAVDDGYVVWCKKLTTDDLVGNPFNAYTNEDLGTVRCAVELNPHPHEE